MADRGALFKELQQQITDENYKKVVEVADKLLAGDSQDLDALHCKALALIHLAQYQPALDTIHSSSDLEKVLSFEQVYCEYKLRKHETAVASLEKLEAEADQSDSRKEISAHLKAQIFYRLGRREEALAIYGQLLKQAGSDVDEQLLVNLCAAASFLKDQASSSRILGLIDGEEVKQSYELAYNLACCMLRSGDLARASDLLIAAQEFCKSSLKSEDYTEAEIEAELAALRLQHGFVQQIMDKGNAEATYQQVLDSDGVSDAEMKAVAVNNLISIQKEQKLFKADKSLQHALSPAVAYKFTSEQLQSFHLNRAIVLLKMNKLDQCKELLATLKKEYPDADVPVLVDAFLISKEKGSELAIEALANAKNTVQVQLTLAQLHLSAGNTAGAAEALAAIEGEDQFLPGVVSAVVSILQKANNGSKAADKINEALSYWKSRSSSPEYLKLLQAAAELNFEQQKYDQAIACYEQLSKVDASRRNHHIARLVVALSEVDPEAAEKYLSSIPDVVERKDVDAEKLENLSSTPSAKKDAKGESETAAAAVSTEGVVQRKKKTKKKRKKRLPKNFDPSMPPDPERWLPRTERSTYKKRRTNKATRGGHQGGGLTRAQLKEESRKLDQRAQAESKKESSPAAKPATSSASAPVKKAPKKKKKGRRR